MSVRASTATALAACLLASNGAPARAEEPQDEEPGTARAGDASAADGDAAARPGKRRKRAARPAAGWTRSLTASVEVRGGSLLGESTVRDAGGFVETVARARPRLERRGLRLEAALAAGDRETFGATFPERSGAVDLRARLGRSTRRRVTINAGLGGVWRPDWPDLYQPLPGGGLAGSSRRSYLEAEGGVEFSAALAKGHRLRVGYAYDRLDYDDDENFDPIDEPTHLVPADRDEHALRAAWKRKGARWAIGAELEAAYRRWSQLYARDAGTGLTHAGAGGDPPNPRQRALNVEPAVLGEREVGDVTVAARYGLLVSTDLFEGYYSYVEHHPEVDVDFPLAGGELALAVDLRWRSYGANSYAANPPDRPALDSGDLRRDTAVGARARYVRPLRGPLDLVASVAAAHRGSTFPDYVPGVFPASSDYAIDWDYDDLTVYVGARWALGGDDDE